MPLLLFIFIIVDYYVSYELIKKGLSVRLVCPYFHELSHYFFMIFGMMLGDHKGFLSKRSENGPK